jgi:hypothetical protein
MALPARLTAALGQHPDHLTEEDLQRAVKSQIPECEVPLRCQCDGAVTEPASG